MGVQFPTLPFKGRDRVGMGFFLSLEGGYPNFFFYSVQVLEYIMVPKTKDLKARLF